MTAKATSNPATAACEAPAGLPMRRTPLPGRAPFTVADLLRFPDDGNRYELSNGCLVVSPSPTPRHQVVLFRLQQVLDAVAPAGLEPLGRVNLKVDEDEFFIPDVVLVAAEAVVRTELMFDPSDIHLIVEVVGPHTRSQDRCWKRIAYADAGIPVYWRVEPSEGPSIHVYELVEGDYVRTQTHKAGEPAKFFAPFEMEFDPAVLIARRSS
ncbi:Uma2 family endonuclease [Sinosporangium album]|uniref:Uma2 family endonuclease n=1 Tax=Sinosporangium album TaxID=504805 RepID=UPI000B80C7D5|nr:Uma2 family endonuclease [Sinosporangium album]